MLKGIDISWWQRDMNVAAVPADFVIVKATGGTRYVSGSCDAQIQAAKRAGRLRGIYHFARDGEGGSATAQQEADHFVDNTLGYHDGETILVLDWEADAVALGPAWAKAWLDRVHARTGIKPLIYMSQSVTQAHDWSAVVAADYGLWVASYGQNPQRNGYATDVPSPGRIAPWPFAAIHQYGDRGRLPGYGADLDLNVAHVDRAGWLRYAAKNGKPVTPTTPPKPTTPPPATSGGKTYTVRPGDTLSGIAAAHGTTWQALHAANRAAVPNPDVIHAGTVLTIPSGGKTYTVRPGDTLSGIADKHGTTWQALHAANRAAVPNPDVIHAGTVLTLP